MNIDYYRSLIKYSKQLNFDGKKNYVDISWEAPPPVKEILKRLIQRFTKYKANTLKFRSIIRKAKHK